MKNYIVLSAIVVFVSLVISVTTSYRFNDKKAEQDFNRGYATAVCELYMQKEKC
jgi:hypothetical protein